MTAATSAPGASGNADGTLAERLAGWVAQLAYEAIPAEAAETAKLLVLDQLGLQLSGATLPNVQPELQMVTAMRAAPESTILGTAQRTVAPYAAFANGTTAGSSEFDDVHMFAAHIGSHVVPPALAFAEITRATGRDVLTAVVAGAQVMSVLGSVSAQSLVERGWHGSKILGTFGAAATAGKLLRLTGPQLAHALGIAGSDAAGGMEYEFDGGEVKRMHSGSASRLGSQAALLARRGLTGPLGIFEGARGLYQLFTGSAARADAITADIWDHYHIIDTAFRMYPTIGIAATVLEGLDKLWETHRFRWQDIEQIRVGLPHVAIGHGAATMHPTDAVTAQFSTAFGIALLLVHGSNNPQDYLNEDLRADPDIAAVIDKVVPYKTDSGPGAPLLDAKVDIVFHDGRTLSRLQHGFRGYPDNPGRAAAVESKFRTIVSGLISPGASDELVNLTKSLEHQPDVAQLIRLAIHQ
jgi:2-methylcitrate dehydratase PrpD